MEKGSVQQIDLEEQVGRRLPKLQNTSISILDPAIYIARSRKDLDISNNHADDKKFYNTSTSSDGQVKSEPEWDYLHFRASFTLEVEILGFERAYVC